MSRIVPSLPAASFEELKALAGALAGVAPELQIDIVDGQFVPAVSWPFTEDKPMEAFAQIRSFSEDFALEIDCMVMEPQQYFDTFSELGVERVIVHIGSTEQFTQTIVAGQKLGFRMGVAFTNDISLFDVEECLQSADYVQIMGIAKVGKQGQPFDERTLHSARTLRDAHPELEIAVDGHVNEKTIPLLKQAGVNRFAPGSAIAKVPDPVVAYHELVTLAGAA